MLARGELVTKVTKKEMVVKLALLHKGGQKADQVAHWRPVVLLNDISDCKLYGLTMEAQRLEQRFLRVDIDFKIVFNSMSQASLWAILEM